MTDWKQKIKQRLPVIILLLATILFWSLYDRYRVVGPVFLESPLLADATRVSGSCTEDQGHWLLQVPEGGKPASVYFRLPEATDYDLIRVRGRLKVDQVVAGTPTWRCARILMTQHGEKNRWISRKHGVASEMGTQRWKHHDEVFEICAEALYVDVVILQTGLSGAAEFDRLVAEPVELRGSFLVWRILFALIWIGMGSLYFRRCRLHRRKLRGLIVLNAVAILLGTLMPNQWIQDFMERGTDAVRSLRAPALDPVVKKSANLVKTPALKRAPSTESRDRFVAMKVETHQAGHFVLFASLCFLVYCSAALERQHLSYFFKVGGDVLLFAVVSESLQFLTIDRTAGIGDLKIDLYGMGVAFLLFIFVLPLLRRFAVKPA